MITTMGKKTKRVFMKLIAKIDRFKKELEKG
jgi:hypothetical protein